MQVAELWRYPVKSMGGERLTRARITPLGIEGDRMIHAERADGRVLTARSHPKLLGHHGAIDAKGIVTVDGRPWDSAEVAADVAGIGGHGATLVRYEGPERFDVLPLLVATDGAIAEFGFDGRRLRANIIIGGVDGMAERGWPGATLRIGGVAIGVQDLRLRCIMTSYDPDTQRQDKSVTRGIYERFEGKLALNCFVAAGGEIAVGDEVTVVRER